MVPVEIDRVIIYGQVQMVKVADEIDSHYSIQGG
jgi:hypothetical protein